MILFTLEREFYNKEEAFCTPQMDESKADGVIPKDFNTKSIYISGKNYYRENTHRALCAIYLGILGDGMKGFHIVKWCDQPDICPWENPAGSDYKSSDEIKNKPEETGDADMVDYYHPCTKRNRTDDGA